MYGCVTCFLKVTYVNSRSTALCYPPHADAAAIPMTSSHRITSHRITSGRRLLDGLVDYVLEQGLADATDLLFGGCSAGGLTAYVHADYVANRMPSTVKTLAVADVGSFSFLQFLLFLFVCFLNQKRGQSKLTGSRN